MCLFSNLETNQCFVLKFYLHPGQCAEHKNHNSRILTMFALRKGRGRHQFSRTKQILVEF